jgi:hypothetical protein
MFLLLLFLLLVQIAMAMRSAGRRPGGSYNSREMIVNTTLMQEFLFNWQHPMNCRTRKWYAETFGRVVCVVVRVQCNFCCCMFAFIVRMAGHIRSSGIGSELHVVSTLFAYAINHEALMIWGPGSMWAEGDNSFDAFFLPITNCTRAMLDPALEIHYHHTDAVRTMVPFPFANQDTYPFPQFYWWRAQAIAYFVQFNPSFQADLNALRRTAFGDRILPCGTICAFIRHGDKGHEMPLLPWSRYWIAIQQTQALIQHIPHHCVRPDFHVFLATDDPQVSVQTEDLYYYFFFLKKIIFIHTSLLYLGD